MAYDEAWLRNPAGNGSWLSTQLIGQYAASNYAPGKMVYTTDLGVMVGTGLAWTVVGSTFLYTTPTIVPSSSFGLVSSTTIDQTTVIQNAVNAAASGGVSIYWLPGVYIYSDAITNSVSWIGAGSNLVELRKLTTNGAGAMITTTAKSDITVSGILFTDPNTPYNSGDTAASTDGCLQFINCTNSIVDDCVFTNQFGVVVIYINQTTGRMTRNRVYTCYHDAFHITGTSTNIERIQNLVEDGGDDAFPIQGYLTTGQVVGVLDALNVVRGCKSARAFAYCGVKGVQNIGCKVDGTIPARYARAATDMSCPAMVIQATTGTFASHGNEDVQVDGFKAVNCGRGASPFSQVVNAVTLFGTSGQISKNIRFNDLSISASASIGLFANGGVASGIDNLSLDGVSIINTSDPNGYVGTAGNAQFSGIQLQSVNNLYLKGDITDSGGDGLNWDNSCTGEFDIDLKSYRINSGAKPTACRIINSTNTGSGLSRLRIRLLIAQQASASSGSQYFLDRIAYLPGPGVIESYVCEQEIGVSIGSVNIFPGSNFSTSVSITASPMTYTNTSGAKQQALVQAGTSVGLTIARGQAGTFGVTTLQPGTMTLSPGESIQLTYTTQGTLALKTNPAEGL